jgi:hypothetical protein
MRMGISPYLALAAVVILLGVGAAGYVVDSQIIAPAIATIGYPPIGTLTVVPQTSAELVFASATHFSMNSTSPVDVVIYVSKASTFTGIYQSTNISTTRMSTNFPAGEVYIIIDNPLSTNTTVTYSVT